MTPVVFTVGRYNPPTKGHDFVFDIVLTQARRLETKPYIFIVDGAKSGLDRQRNPLSAEFRFRLLNQIYPEFKIDIINDAYQALEVLEVQGLNPAFWVAGSDRVPRYQKLLNSQGLQGQIISVNRDSGLVANISASRARKSALAGEIEEFKSLISGKFDHEISDLILQEILVQAGDINVRNHTNCRNTRFPT
jgi:hypothetical protein